MDGRGTKATLFQIKGLHNPKSSLPLWPRADAQGWRASTAETSCSMPLSAHGQDSGLSSNKNVELLTSHWFQQFQAGLTSFDCGRKSKTSAEIRNCMVEILLKKNYTALPENQNVSLFPILHLIIKSFFQVLHYLRKCRWNLWNSKCLPWRQSQEYLETGAILNLPFPTVNWQQCP